MGNGVIAPEFGAVPDESVLVSGVVLLLGAIGVGDGVGDGAVDGYVVEPLVVFVSTGGVGVVAAIFDGAVVSVADVRAVSAGSLQPASTAARPIAATVR